MNHRSAVVGVALVVVVVLGGCTTDPLAQQYQSGTNQNYISGDGAYTEIPAAKRDAPIVFSGMTQLGDAVSSADFTGKPLVVNFWYAGCPPCRLEAKDLVTMSTAYAGKVPFLGINIFDTAVGIANFMKDHSVEYPSIVDADSASAQLAFAGSVAPNAVPTTLVIDSRGRVAGRISGLLRDPLVLSAMIDRVLAETKS